MNLHPQLRKYLRVYPEWRFAPPHVQLKRRMERLGSDYGGYFLDASMVRGDSIVYSLGIGEDISFDLSLIARFGMSIEAFDPTPKVKKWLASQPLPPQFHFHAAGIAGHDGEETFYLPPREDWVSHSVIPARQFGRESVRFPVMRLSTAMQLQKHDRIDILKMDIEGAEYAVIEQIVREKIQVAQLLVEFHHRLCSLGTDKTRKALALLEEHGLRISSVCPRKEIFTFVQVV
ncbi:MAG: FkbM family methyltransferase [Candidatus Acidiferrales bacterium]